MHVLNDFKLCNLGDSDIYVFQFIRWETEGWATDNDLVSILRMSCLNGTCCPNVVTARNHYNKTLNDSHPNYYECREDCGP